MSSVPQQLGRRERNKQEKLERIVAAARELFAERGIDAVTTQQIADKADIGAGTLFLYAKTKGELLLMVHNSGYADALSCGKGAADCIESPLNAVMAIVRSVVECNRAQVENGRTYLREMIFGDHAEPHHHAALVLNAQTEAAVAAVLQRRGNVSPDDAISLARIVSAVMFVAMAASIHVDRTTDDVVEDIRAQLQLILPHENDPAGPSQT